jgi:hypothetical protein
MSRELYRYRFDDLPAAEVRASLALSLSAAESLHGQAQVRLDAAHVFDERKRRCVIDASTPVGIDVNRLFVGFLRCEFGAEAFRVERIAAPAPS